MQYRCKYQFNTRAEIRHRNTHSDTRAIRTWIRGSNTQSDTRLIRDEYTLIRDKASIHSFAGAIETDMPYYLRITPYYVKYGPGKRPGKYARNTDAIRYEYGDVESQYTRRCRLYY